MQPHLIPGKPFSSGPDAGIKGWQDSVTQATEQGVAVADEARITGTRDRHYNLVSVLYHALQEAETCEQYIRDAEREDDREAAEFFRAVQEENRRRSERAKELLVGRLGSDAAAGDKEAGGAASGGMKRQWSRDYRTEE